MIDRVGPSRTDDLVGGRRWRYEQPERLHQAWTTAEVVPALEAVRRAAQSGRWLVGYVAYEAGSAFDAALVCRDLGDSMPLVAFAEYRSRSVAPALEPAPTAPVDPLQRLGGSSWYRLGVQTIRERIAAGDVYQVNLTDRLHGPFTGDAFAMYRQMALGQRGAYNAFVDLGRHVVVGASPELFFDFDGETVITKPMKGTAERGPRDHDDDVSRAALVSSEKERAENVMIVDLIRNDLSKISVRGGVTVASLFDAERYETVWQLTSTVRARSRRGTSFVDVFAALFPSGSVTGAPKVAATAVIDELEPAPRGIYCGAVGVVGPHPAGIRDEPVARFSVAIRTAHVDRVEGTVTYGAGGGITTGSDPASEEAELRSKTKVLTVNRPEFELIETLFLDDTGARHGERHVSRMIGSARYFGFGVDGAELGRRVSELSAEVPSRLRIVLARDGSIRVEVEPLGEVASEVTVAVASSRIDSRDPFGCHKTTHRDHYRRAREECPGVDDAIVVNERDELVETTVASLLYLRDGRWFTPPLSCGGLDGVGRRVALEDGSVTERVLVLDDIGLCDDFAVISSLRGRRRAILCPPEGPTGAPSTGPDR